MRVVLDTNVLISSLLFNGKSRIVYDYCIERTDLFISDFIIDELKEKLLTKFRLRGDMIERITDGMKNVFELRTPHTKLPSVCRDADDNNILQLCESVNAEYLVTGDKDLVILKHHRETNIVTPHEFLRITASS